MVVIESAVGTAPWTAGGGSSVRGVDPALRPCIGRGRSFGGYDPGGANVGFADGSVHFVGATTDPTVYEAAATIAGGEPVREKPGYPRGLPR